MPMMHQADAYRYLDGDTFQALELPYEGNELSMIVLLPKKADGLADLEKGLTATRLADWLAQLRPHQGGRRAAEVQGHVELRLKKRCRSWACRWRSRGQGRLLGHDEREQVCSSPRWSHKAFVDVNEKGTEAAAARRSS